MNNKNRDSQKNIDSNKPNVPLPYRPLSPINSADPEGNYCAALSWALKNRKKNDIKNIALTGPFGSGKSSILKTFEDNNEDPNLVFLNISLATFKDEKYQNSNNSKELDVQADLREKKAQDSNLLRLIELSILQQIFYHEEDDTIPDTRFKKTRNFPDKKVTAISVLILIFSFALINQLFPNLFQEKLRVPFPIWLEYSIHYLTLTIVIVFSFYFLWCSIRPLRSIRLKKFNFQDVEFGVDDNVSKSILNDHLDEILYFFEVTDYSVVVIEDLDRFEQTEIFTKLRELNHLINYSKKIKQDVTFIYAVRDDMFQDKDRTKFFDFIIPVIPIINSSNSNEILRKIKDENNYNIKEDLLDDISLFVDDMRLLYNIMNEFHLYQVQLDMLNQNSMLAIIVYKNIYPNDFVALSNGEGQLFEIMESKPLIVKEKIEKIDLLIQEIKEEIKQIESVTIKKENELRKLYIFEYLNKYPQAKRFRINDVDLTFSQVIQPQFFESFRNGEVEYYYQTTYQEGLMSLKASFEEIEKLVDPELDYKKRLNLIADSTGKKSEELKLEIVKLEEQKMQVRNTPMKLLLQDYSVKIDSIKQQQLINILLRAGYIDESYLDYVSIFYEGSISRIDKEFLLNVKAHIKTNFDLKLIKVDKLVDKIPYIEYDQEFVLNYSFLDFLFSKSSFKSQRKRILCTLSNESDLSWEFINGYIDISNYQGKFIKEICSSWPKIWNYITTKATLTEERINYFLKLILKNLDIVSIQEIAAITKLKSYIEDYPKFLNLLEDYKKSYEIIYKLNIQFNKIDFEESPKYLIDEVLNGNHYVITKSMLKDILEYNNVYLEEKFTTKNYSYLKANAPKEVIEYIDNNIENYFKNVWSLLPKNVNEEEEFLIAFLNNEQIHEDHADIIIKNTETKISELNKLRKELFSSLLNSNKILPTWDNVIEFFLDSENEIDEVLFKYLSIDINHKLLSEIYLNNSELKYDREVLEELAYSIFQNNSFSDETYSDLIKGIPYAYDNADFLSGLSEEKVTLLIKMNRLSYNIENYAILQEMANDQHIHFAERKPEIMVPEIIQFDIETREATLILRSSKFSSQNKSAVIDSMSEEVIFTDISLLKAILSCSLAENEFKISESIIKRLLTSKLDITPSIRLYNQNSKNLDKKQAIKIIETWPEPYSEMVINGKRPLIPDTVDNRTLLRSLISIGLISKMKEESKGLRVSTFLK